MPIMAFQDENGAAYGVKHVLNKPRVSAMPYLYDIAEGNVANHSTLYLAGYNGTSAVTTVDLVSATGVYAWQSAASAIEVVSSDNTQDTASGTGARTVQIDYLTTAGVEATATATLNGTTVVAVTGVTDCFRVNGFKVLTTGTGGVPVGTITVRNSADTPVLATIPAGYNRSQQIIYTVPAGKTLYIPSIYVGSGGAAATDWVRFNLMIRTSPTTPFYSAAEMVTANSSLMRDLMLPIKVTAGSDLKMSFISKAVASPAYGSIRGWIE